MTMTLGETHLLHKLFSQSQHYLEFGAGQSTHMAVQTPNLKTIDVVESDYAFVQAELLPLPEIQSAQTQNRLNFHFVDIGPIETWGGPQDDSQMHLWPNYALSIFCIKSQYDLVLIDGRFRVACALSCILNTSPQTKIMIHDFWNRKEYYILLKFLTCLERRETFGVFQRNARLNLKELQYLLQIYQYAPYDKPANIRFDLVMQKSVTPTEPSRPSPNVQILSSDGAWCWFQDPRALYYKGQFERTYAQWVTHTGDLQVGAYDHQTQAVTLFTLKSNWGQDDHNVGAFIRLPDGRLMIFYAQHEGQTLFCRQSAQPENIHHWESEQVICQAKRLTYVHPLYLANEKKFYVFWRGETWQPSFSTSEDGIQWSEPQILFQSARQATHLARPYFKVSSDGQAVIHFVFTDGHPRDEIFNSVYYLRYCQGRFFKANDQVICTPDQLPISPQQADCVYEAHKTQVKAWIWDLATDAQGLPVIAYTRLPAETEHQYHWVRWTGKHWDDHYLTSGGPWFPQTPVGKKEKEPHYSGGIALHPSDPSICYLSRPIQNCFEIEKWHWDEFTWTKSAITNNSQHNNVRPLVPHDCPAERDHLLWMFGSYLHYTRFQTQILLLP